jgi:hypothetical protein
MQKPEQWARITERLGALSHEEPSTKTGKIQQLLPQIEKARQAGITVKRLCEELNKEGLEISYRDFRVLLSRVRRRARNQATLLDAAHPAGTGNSGAAVEPLPGESPRSSTGAHSERLAASIREQKEKLQKETWVHNNEPDSSKLY